MALAGNIKEFGLADIFQIVSLQQKTGELLVKSSKGNVSVLLENGLIVGADASFRSIEERLYQSLLRSQGISKFQLKRATEVQKKTLQPLWSALAEIGTVDRSLLQKTLSRHIHETIYNVLRWTEGEYRFEPRKSVEYDRELISPINTEFLVMEGFRITDEWSEIEKEIPSFHLRIHRISQEVPGGLSEAETTVLQLLTKERTVQEIIDMAQFGEFDSCQTIYELMKKHLVEAVQGRNGKAVQVRQISIGISDILMRALAVIVGIVLVIGVFVGFSYLPEDFILIHQPSLSVVTSVKQFVARSELTHFSQLVPRYFLTSHRAPTSLDDLQQNGLFLSKRMVKDPWGYPYLLDSQQVRVIISSPGHDGRPNTEDDLTRTVSF